MSLKNSETLKNEEDLRSQILQFLKTLIFLELFKSYKIE